MAAHDAVVQSPTSRFKKFFREVKAELKKVTWPTKKELISYTGVVFVAVIICATLIWILDTGFSGALKLFLQ